MKIKRCICFDSKATVRSTCLAVNEARFTSLCFSACSAVLLTHGVSPGSVYCLDCVVLHDCS